MTARVTASQAPQSHSAYLEQTGAKIYYEECGSGSAVILLHDGLLHSVVWDDIWKPLCSKYHVVRYDRRGYGRSDPAKTPFWPEQDLWALMRRLQIERAALVGSSSGSGLALDFAIAHPDKVAALFLIGPVVHGMRSSDYFVLRGNAANAPLAKDDIRAAAENWSKDPFEVSGARPEARKKVFDTLIASPQNLRVAGQFEIRPSPPTVSRLSEIEAPTLMIIGEADIADVHAFSGAIQAAVPVVRREVWKDAGHLVQLEKPDELVARLDAFLEIAEQRFIPLPADKLTKFAGAYLFLNSTALITVKRGRLVLRIDGDADIPLFAASETSFFVRTTGTEVKFENDTSGRVSAMIIRNANGAPVTCTRISTR